MIRDRDFKAAVAAYGRAAWEHAPHAPWGDDEAFGAGILGALAEDRKRRVDGRGSAARYRRAVEARVEEWERWSDPDSGYKHVWLARYDRAARRARAILERLEAKR